MKITYEKATNSAYVYFTSPETHVAKTYPCDPIEVGGMINSDFDKDGKIVGIEVLGASSYLSKEMLSKAEQLGR